MAKVFPAVLTPCLRSLLQECLTEDNISEKTKGCGPHPSHEAPRRERSNLEQRNCCRRKDRVSVLHLVEAAAQFSDVGKLEERMVVLSKQQSKDVSEDHQLYKATHLQTSGMCQLEATPLTGI
ncbi:CCDC19 [Symbiodinium sp. CCMP2592]|nr:CCDC19 [Symbiodinium sp. CCMP2592]